MSQIVVCLPLADCFACGSPSQGRLYRSLKLWSFYCDLEESLGTLESARAVYDRILDLRIATPQLVLNYALFLQARAPAQHANAFGIPMLGTFLQLS